MLLATHHATLRWCNKKGQVHHNLQYGLVCNIASVVRSVEPDRNRPGNGFSYLFGANLYLLKSIRQQAEKKHQSCQKDTKGLQPVPADNNKRENCPVC